MNRNILTNNEFSERIKDCSKNANESLIIFSAFVKSAAIDWLSSYVSNVPTLKIIARWSPEDLAFKASDLEVYEVCKQKGWEFGVDNSLHSKAFIFDSKIVLLGSANLTDRGLSISRDGNLEMGTVIEPTVGDLERLKELEKNVTWLDDSLYKEIKEQISILDIEKPKVPSWSSSLKDKLYPSVEHLWISELLHTNPSLFEWPDLDNLEVLHDIELLSLPIENSRNQELLKEKFLSCREYRWFKQQLLNANEDKYTNFGWLTDKLHNAILDDPPPYRSGVKQYVSDLVKWIEVFANCEIKVVQHQQTISFSLK